MIPFQKIFTLVVRTFSKPMLSLMKKKQQEGKLGYFRWLFVGLGRKYQAFEHWLNHRLLKTSHKKQMTELKEEILLEKGVEAFYELFFYSIVIGIPMYELYKAAESAEKKDVKLKAKIDSMEGKLDSANQSLKLLLGHIENAKHYEESMKADRQMKLEELLRNRQQSRFKVEVAQASEEASIIR
jgi:hypothetical protein